jgi:catechol 2,3-dioxygenase-like lactoylglutathione lyase family enzyme
MIDHMALAVSDFATSKAFYTKALAPLGYRVLERDGDQPAAGFGDLKADFWIAGGGPTAPRAHIAFAAKTRAAVDAFHKAALAAGGRDNGAPGIRAHYHPHYYGAFVLDPDGHNIEAVCRAPAARPRRRAAKRAAGAARAKTGRRAAASKPKQPARRKPAAKNKAKRR